jgi:hypothetical protein
MLRLALSGATLVVGSAASIGVSYHGCITACCKTRMPGTTALRGSVYKPGFSGVQQAREQRACWGEPT